jgi:hypothetical protein
MTMRTFLPMFFLVVIVSGAMSLAAMLVLARIERAPIATNLRRRFWDFWKAPLREKERQLRHVAFAVFIGIFFCLILANYFPEMYANILTATTVATITAVVFKYAVFG